MNLRTLLALFALPLCALAFGCSHGAPAPTAADEAAPEVGTVVEGDKLVRTFDLNGDGKPDDWRFYRLVADPQAPAKTIERQERREMDTNFDGKPDIITWFDEDGARIKESLDLDFDGQPDVVALYEHGVLVRKETWQRHGKTPDGIAYYEGGKKVRVERDATGHGRVDTWEYYENGKLSRVGTDVDGDGLVDRWFKAKDEDDDEKPAAKKPAASK
ncbi:MAG: hypothetical protein JST92_05395 [Deltaproteobacteria bacterium]|nr:hypothetical protein [Deltaproteobacteria bacterium]